MTKPINHFLFVGVVCTALAISACDAPAQDSDLPVVSEGSPGVSGSASAGAPGMDEGVSVEVLPDVVEGSPGEADAGAGHVHSDVPPPARDTFHDASCSFEGWVGKKVDEAAIKAEGRPFRILTPDSMMTMDHSPDRINVEHDGNMTVTRVWCG